MTSPSPRSPLTRAPRLAAVAGALALSVSSLGAVGAAVPGASASAPRAASATPTVSPSASPSVTLSPTPTATPTAAPPPPPVPTPTPTPPPPLPPSVTGSDITVVQANLESPQSVPTFLADVATVRAQAPDLITYNEVAFRNDVNLAPAPGYAMWRTPGQYTGATPVAWRTDKWSPLANGTEMLSDYTGIPKGKQTQLGNRHANWVTLQSPEGRVLSLVSAHLAPLTKGMPDVRRPAVQRLAGLVDRLDDHGPVLVGGDMNMHHLGSDYASDLFTAAGMLSTYDLLGTRFPTYDGKGAIIDYLFLKGSDLQADVHFPVEVNSDHHLLVAGFSWTTDANVLTSSIANLPDGSNSQRKAVLRAVRQPIRDAQRGGIVQLATARFALTPVHRDLVAAKKRGVKVRIITRSNKLNKAERRLKAAVSGKGSWVRRCAKSCAKSWGKQDRPDTLMLVSDARRTPLLRLDVSRQLRKAIIERPTRVTVSHGPLSLQDAADIFRTLR